MINEEAKNLFMQISSEDVFSTTSGSEPVWECSILAIRTAHHGSACIDYVVRVKRGPGSTSTTWHELFANLSDKCAYFTIEPIQGGIDLR
jgi:hypothetical protein